MTPSINIAISGKLGSAKTYCADLLVEKHGHQRMSFATPLKTLLHRVRRGEWSQMAEELFDYPWSAEENTCYSIRRSATNAAMEDIIGFVAAYLDDRDLWEGKGRRFLQLIGTGYFRAKHPGIWVRLFERVWYAHTKIAGRGIVYIRDLPNHIPVVVDDLRFPDELECLKKLGFMTLRCTVDDDTRLARIKQEDLYAVDHVSEHALDDAEFDGYIDTSCPIDDQYDKLMEAISSVCGMTGKEMRGS